jgi:hypothetical protein
VAAPTAGLHFTAGILDQCRRAGAEIAYVTLHVGLGTFQPIHGEDVTRHHLHAERYEITAENQARIHEIQNDHRDSQYEEHRSQSCLQTQSNLLARNGAVTLDTNSITTPVCPGSIQVVKNTVNGNGTFAFTSSFGLASLTTVGGTAHQTFDGLTAGGSFHVSETVPSGWTQNSATCTNGSPAAVIVLPDVTTICTFVNTLGIAPPPGSITIVKNTLNGNGTFEFTSNFGLTSLTTVTAGTA